MEPQRWTLLRGLGLAVLAATLLQVPVLGAAPPATPGSSASTGAASGAPSHAGGVIPRVAEWRRLHEALAGLQAQEKAVLADLFRLGHAVQEAQARVRDLEARRQAVQADLAAARDELARTQALLTRRRDEAGRLLRLVQYLGPASYLRVLLGAESWADFTRRLGAVTVTLRTVRQTLGRLRDIEAQRRQWEGLLAAREAQLAAAVRDEEAGLARLAAAQAEREAALTALGVQRTRYLARLEELEQAWLQFVRPAVERMGAAFRRLAGEVREIPGARAELSSGGVRLRVPEAGLNQLLAADPDLRGFRFRLEDGGVRLEAPELALVLSGRFAIQDDTALVYEVEGAELAGVTLDPDAVRGALGGPGPAVDLAPALGTWKLRSVRVAGGELEFTVGIGLGRDGRSPAAGVGSG